MAINIACQQKAGAENIRHIRIAVAFSSSDKYNLSTERIIKGIYTAKFIFEKKNKNYQIDLIKYNFHHHNLVSVINTGKKICTEKILLVIGAEMSDEALMLGDTLATCPAPIVLITPTGTNPRLNENRPNVFTMSVSDKEISRKIADFVYKKFKLENIGVIESVSLPYSNYLGKSFTEHYHELNPGKIYTQKILREHSDFQNEINEFITRKVKIVIMLTYDMDLKRFSYQAAKNKYFPIFIGSDGWGSNEAIIKMARQYEIYGNNFTAYRNYPWNGNGAGKLNTPFNQLYRSRYHEKPDAWDAIGFDSGWVAMTALSNTKGNFSFKNIRNSVAMFNSSELLTTRNFSFMKDNSPHKNIYIHKITADGSQHVCTMSGKG